MKKVIALILMLSIVAGTMPGCALLFLPALNQTEQPLESVVRGDDPEQNTTIGMSPAEPTESTMPQETIMPPETTGQDSFDIVTITEKTVYDYNGIRITAKELGASWLGTDIKLLVENNSTENITISADAFVVNGITIDGSMYIDVAAGKKANDSITLYAEDLDVADIDVISSIECRNATIIDSDSYSTVAEVAFIVETSAQGYVQPIDDTGDIIFQKAGITVIAKCVSGDLFGKTVRLFTKNETGKDVILQADNISVNDFTIPAWMYDTIFEGTVRFCELDLWSSGLEENEIENIEAITFTLEVIDPETYGTIAESDEIAIKVKE